jgi:hypothetical protein
MQKDHWTTTAEEVGIVVNNFHIFITSAQDRDAMHGCRSSSYSINSRIAMNAKRLKRSECY